MWLLASLCWQAIPVRAQQIERIDETVRQFSSQERQNDAARIFNDLLRQGRGDEFSVLLEKLFGDDEAESAAIELGASGEELFLSVFETASRKASEDLEKKIAERKEKKNTGIFIAPETKKSGVKKPAGTKNKPIRKSATNSKKFGFNNQPQINWRQLAFGFHRFSYQDEKPEIKMTETDKEIKAEGTDKKSFETKDAKGSRIQKAETKYTKDGATFGMEIKNLEIIEAVSKADGKSFRRETSMVWGADVAACPDENGISNGAGKAKVISKTVYTESGETVTMITDFDLQAKLSGSVSDRADLKSYDMQIDAYVTNSGFEDALRRNIIKEIKIRDGRYGLHFDIAGNTIEISDGKYGGSRTPAKIGKINGRELTPLPEADGKAVGSAIGSMIPAIWNSANEMYKTAERSWKNNGCVEVVCRAPKTKLKAGEEIDIAAETVHLQDKSKVNAELNAEAYQAQVTPETQSANPKAVFTLTQEGDEKSTFFVKSVSKRGIGEGEFEFQPEKEETETPKNGAWTGMIKAERKQREEKEKRSGANLAENGGYIETVTNVELQLTGALDDTVDSSNAHIANVTGVQETVDYEYDRYKIDEGYCGPNAVPYKGPKEMTRTSTTTVNYNKDTRVYVEIGATGGSLAFSLPEQTGATIHRYVHKSPCAEHDRVNTNDAIDENAPTIGGGFSFSIPVDSSQNKIKGTITVRDENGGTTVYTWELTRR